MWNKDHCVHDAACAHEETCVADDAAHEKHGKKSTFAKVVGTAAIAGTVALAVYGIAKRGAGKCEEEETVSAPDGAPFGEGMPGAV